MNKIRNNSGFTLIEVMIVVAVIGILAAVAIPQFASYRQRAQDTAAKSALHQMAKAQENYYVLHNRYTLDRNNLETQSGWFVENTINVNILAAGAQSFSATAKHQSSPAIFTYSSSSGGLQ